MVERIAAKLNIEKRRAEILITALVVFVLAICAVPATRAFFEAGSDITVDMRIGGENTEFTYNLPAGALKNPGDTKEITLSVSCSEGDIPMRYYFTVERDGSDDVSRLAAYLGVYWDDQYVGMLSDITTGKLGTFDEGGAVPACFPEGAGISGGAIFDNTRYFVMPGDTQEHKLKLEYHIGASAIDAASARTEEIRICGHAETIRLQDETVVNTPADFEQVVLLSNYEKLTQNRVILGKDITIDKDLTLDNVNPRVGALHIDLNGHTLNFSTHHLTVKDGTSGSGILILHDSCGVGRAGSVTGGSGSIILQGSNAYIAGEGMADIAEGLSFNVSGYSMSNETKTILYDRYIIPQAKKNVKGGVQSGTTNQFIKGYGAYGDALSISASSYVGYNGSTGTITPNAEKNMNGIVNMDGRAFIFEIIGSLGSDGMPIKDVVDQIETRYLPYLKEGDEHVIYYDILLPTRLKGYNCHIEWFSSNPEFLDATGNYTSPWTEQDVTLQAVYTVNDFTEVRTYNVKVKGYSYEEKTSYFLAHMGVIKYNLIPEDAQLWNKDNYYKAPEDANSDNACCNKDLGITNIDYFLPSEYESFLRFSDATKSTLTLYSISDLFEAHINVEITFDAPPELGGVTQIGDNKITREIPVIIDLDDYTTTEDIYKYVQKYIMDQMPSSDEWTVPVDLYDRMSYHQGSEHDWYPKEIKLPGYYEAVGYQYDDQNNQIEYTVGFHTIEYLVVNTKTGGIGEGDEDGEYDEAKTGTLKIEYTNTESAYNAVTLTSAPGIETIYGVSPGNVTGSGVKEWTLKIDPSKLKSDDQDLNIIVCLDTEFAGKPDPSKKEGDPDYDEHEIPSTYKDRRNIKFLLPGVLRPDMFNGIDESGSGTANGLGQVVYNKIRATGDFANSIPTQEYIFTRDAANVTYLDISGINAAVADKNLWPLKYFSGLTNLTISGTDTKYDVSDGTVGVLSKHTKLEYLDLSNCRITDVDDLSGLTNLEYFNVSNNSDLDHVTVIANMAGNLGMLNVAGTKCDAELNEWAYAYAYYRYRDEHNGDKPVFNIKTADGTARYEVPFPYWQYPEAYLKYRKLVYTNAEYREIGEASVKVGYVWIPRQMIGADNRTWTDSYFGSGFSEGWVAMRPDNSYANVRITQGSGFYAGPDISIPNSTQTRGIAGHRITVPNVSTRAFDIDLDAFAAEQVTKDVESIRYFFFDIVDIDE